MAPTDATAGPQRQYRRPRRAISGGLQASEYSMTRAARILVKVSAQYIAREANVTKEELRDFEKGRHDLS